METKEYKRLIEVQANIMRKAECAIEDLADKAMLEYDKEVPYVNQDGTQSDTLTDEAQWFHIKFLWDCPDSPFGWCMYHMLHDPAMDSCVFCGQPYERK